MIIDCFMFFNEVDVLRGRLEYLYDTVDYFVIVESNLTHSGNLKEMNFMQQMHKFQPYLDKVLYWPLALNSTDYEFKQVDQCNFANAQWQVENAQRNHIAKALEFFDNNAIVIVSDCDEIPNTAAIDFAKNHLTNSTPAFSFQQEMFYYNFNQKQEMPWLGSVITTNGYIKKKNPQWFRDNRNSLPFITGGGWHLSYWGDAAHIRHKIENFAHQEFNKEKFTDIKWIESKIASGQDLFDRNNKFVPFNISQLPNEIRHIFAPRTVEHYAASVDGFFNEDDFEFYRQVIAASPNHAHIVEVGSYKGRSSSFAVVEIIHSKKQITFDCVDTWQGSEEHQTGQQFEDADVVNNCLFEVFQKNMEPVKGHYRAVRLSSLDAAKTYADNSIDVVFIDAAHDYVNVRSDILAWIPKVKIGGIISGHDYHYGPVIQAVRDTIGDCQSIGSCWFKIKS